MGFCAAPASSALVQGLLGSVDCNIRALSELGYHAISAPDSQVSIALTVILTLYVAVLGFRLMLGLAPMRAGDVTLNALKIGLVLALASDWPAYQQIIFQALFQGPEQLTASMLQAIAPGNTSFAAGPFGGLQATVDELQSSATFFAHAGAAAPALFSGGPPAAAIGLNFVSYLLLLSSLGFILVAKIVLGLLLALGPVFAGLLLFDSTRGMFLAWLRAAVAFSLVPLIATLTLAVQFVLLAPYLDLLSQMRASGQPDLGLADTICVLSLICAAVSVMGVGAMFLIARGMKFPGWGNSSSFHLAAAASSPSFAAGGHASSELRTRHTTAAHSVEREQVRETDMPRRSGTDMRRADKSRDTDVAGLAPAFRSSARPSRAAARRDR